MIGSKKFLKYNAKLSHFSKFERQNDIAYLKNGTTKKM